MREPFTSIFALRRPISTWTYRLATVVSFLAVLGGWTWVSHQSWVNPIFIPKPEDVWRVGLDLIRDENLGRDVKMSFLRVTYGFLLSAALGIPLGILIGAFEFCEGLLQPLTEFIRYIPVPALVPILMILFGIDELSKVMLIFIGTFFQLVLMVADAVRRVPYDLVQVSYTLGARRRDVLELVLARSAMPEIFDALRLCNGWAWTYVVVAELVAANDGLGYRILKFSRFLQTPKIWFYLLVLGVIGLALDIVFRKFNQRVFRWANPSLR